MIPDKSVVPSEGLRFRPAASTEERIQERDYGPREVEKMQHHWNGRDVG